MTLFVILSDHLGFQSYGWWVFGKSGPSTEGDQQIQGVWVAPKPVYLSTRIQNINPYVLSSVQKQHEALLADQKILRDGIDNNNNFAKQFKKRSEERKASIEDEKKKRTMIIQKEKVCINKNTDTRFIP